MQSRPASGRRRRVTGRGLGLLALSVTVLIWGSTFVISDVALTDMGPATLTFARFAVSLLVLLPFGIARGLRVDGLFRRRYAVCGLTGVALYYGLQNLGLRFTTPDSAALLQAALPVLTVGLGVFWLGESVSARRVACLGRCKCLGTGISYAVAPVGDRHKGPGFDVLSRWACAGLSRCHGVGGDAVSVDVRATQTACIGGRCVHRCHSGRRLRFRTLYRSAVWVVTAGWRSAGSGRRDVVFDRPLSSCAVR